MTAKGEEPMMRKSLVVLLVASLVPFLGTARGGAVETAASTKPRLLVVWHDAHRLYPGHHGGVAREVTSLFGPLELEMHWQRAGQYDPPLDARTILLRIVLLPSDPDGAGWELGGDVMGAVLPGTGRTRSVYVFYRRLVRGLKLKSQEGRVPDLNERKLLEKALGRVVAHEMVHAVAPSVRHAKRGLMRPSVTRSFLAGDDVVVSGSLKQAFFAGIERALATPSASMASPVDPVTPQVLRQASDETELGAPDRGGS